MIRGSPKVPCSETTRRDRAASSDPEIEGGKRSGQEGDHGCFGNGVGIVSVMTTAQTFGSHNKTGLDKTVLH